VAKPVDAQFRVWWTRGAEPATSIIFEPQRHRVHRAFYLCVLPVSVVFIWDAMTENLAILKEAARSREWTLLQNALTALLSELGTYPALELTLERLRKHLPTFERYHPDDAQPSGKVIRDLMVSVMSFGFAPENLPEYLVGEYPTPGSGQFVNAVLEMCRAMQKDREPDDRFGLLASAIANSLLAELSEFWYSRHPEEYQRVRANRIDPDTGEYTDPDAAKIPLLFWIDPQVAARDTGGWLRIAYLIEKKLNSHAG
jgi:hypothetical protein